MAIDQTLLDLLDTVIGASSYTETQRRIAKQLQAGFQSGKTTTEAAVRTHLADGGPVMAASTFRKHIELFNTNLKTQSGGFSLRMSKGSVIMDITPNSIGEQLRNVVDPVAARIDMSKLVPPRASRSDPALGRLQVFFSYAWLKPDSQHDIQIDFFDRLSTKLKHPPATFAHLPVISLWRDTAGISAAKGGKNGLTPQCLQACQDSFLVLVMASDKHPHSPTCKKELACFIQANGDDCDGKSSIIIPVNIAGHNELPSHYSGGERLLRDFKGGNLLDWAAAPEAEKDRYVRDRADEIFRLVDALPPSPSRITPIADEIDTGSPSDLGEKMRRLQALDPSMNPNAVVAMKASRAANMHGVDKGIAAEGIDIVAELMDWARSRRGPQVIAILGEFGMGKTTTCQLFTEQLLEECRRDKSLPVPLYLDLRNLQGLRDPGNAELATFLPSLLRAHFGSTPPDADQLLAYVRKEGSIIIFDGLDEVTNKMGKDEAQRLYRRLLEIIQPEHWKQARAIGKGAPMAGPRLIISCRSHYFRDVYDQESFLTDRDRAGLSVDDVALFFMLPFAAEQIRSYFVKRVGEDAAEKAIEMISGSKGLEEIAARPVLLKMLHEVLPELEQQLIAGKPIDMHAVYELFINRAIQRDGGKWTVREDDKKQLLGELALHLWHIQSESIEAKALGKWLETILLEAGQFPVLKEMVRGAEAATSFDLILQDMRNAALLVRAGEGSFRFAHASLREFFLAEALHRHIGEKRLKLESRDEPNVVPPETLVFLVSRQKACNGNAEGRAFVAGFPQLLAMGGSFAERHLGVRLLINTELQLTRPDVVDCSGIDFSWYGQEAVPIRTPGMQRILGENRREGNRTSFQGAIFSAVVFEGIDFTSVDWELAAVSGVTFQSCILESASLHRAWLRGTQCRDCTFIGSQPVSDGMNMLVTYREALPLVHTSAFFRKVERRRSRDIVGGHMRWEGDALVHFLNTSKLLISIDRHTGESKILFDISSHSLIRPTADGLHWYVVSGAKKAMPMLILDSAGKQVVSCRGSEVMIPFMVMQNGHDTIVFGLNRQKGHFEVQEFESGRLVKTEKFEITSSFGNVRTSDAVWYNVAGNVLHRWAPDGARTQLVLPGADTLTRYSTVAASGGDFLLGFSNTHAGVWTLDGAVVHHVQPHGHDLKSIYTFSLNGFSTQGRIVLKISNYGSAEETSGLDVSHLWELAPDGSLVPFAKVPHWFPRNLADFHYDKGWLVSEDFAFDLEAYAANDFNTDKTVAMRFIRADDQGRIGHVAVEPDAAGTGLVATHVSPEAYRFFHGIVQQADGSEAMCAIEDLVLGQR